MLLYFRNEFVFFFFLFQYDCTHNDGPFQKKKLISLLINEKLCFPNCACCYYTIEIGLACNAVKKEIFKLRLMNQTDSERKVSNALFNNEAVLRQQLVDRLYYGLDCPNVPAKA